jgi:tetratricopeptide (TPR) repeat protein
MQSGWSLSVAVMVLVASLFLSLLSGLNQVMGFFSRISLATAILSVILAIVVALVFPELLQKKWPAGQTVLAMPPRLFCIAIALLITLFGVGPFVGKYAIAKRANSRGLRLFDLHQYGSARVHLAHAARYFDDLGFNRIAAICKVPLIQIHASLGNQERADVLIKEAESSVSSDVYLQGKLYVAQGNIDYQRGNIEKAERFYQLAHQTVKPKSHDEAVLFQNEGVLWADRGAYYRDRVQQNYQQARQIYQTLNDKIGLAQLLINEGNLYENDPIEARNCYEQALREAEDVKEPHFLGTIYLNIGRTFRQQGDLDQAEDFYVKARLKFQQAADLLGQAEVSLNRATLERIRGRTELAKQSVQQSESYLQNVDPDTEQVHPRKLAQIRTFQADIYDAFGESETAEVHYREALSIYSKYPDPLREAETMVNYGGLLLRLGRGQEARGHLKRAWEILDAYGGESPGESVGVLYNNIGKAHQDMGDYTNALKHYGKAAQIFDGIGERMLYAQARENIGIIHIWQRSDGKEDIQEALKTYRELGNRDQVAKTLFNLYSVYSKAGDSSAENMVQEILSLLEEHNIDQYIEGGILLGILPQDVSNKASLIVFRERLQQLRAFYEERNEPTELGRSLLQLARAEQKLANFTKMWEYAKEAEAYADHIPLPLRILFHSDLGFFLFQPENPEKGMGHFWQAFDLAEGVAIDQQRNLIVIIQPMMVQASDSIDREKHRRKVQHVLENTEDAEIRRICQEMLHFLSSTDQ